MGVKLEHKLSKVGVEDIGLSGFENAGGVWVFSNDNGHRHVFTPFGMTHISAIISDVETILGFDSLDKFLNDKSYQGRVIVPFANRIPGARITIPGQESSHVLYANDGNHNLHSGEYPDSGFIQGCNRVWRLVDHDEHDQEGGASITYKLLFLKMQNTDFPGNLEVRCKIRFDEDGRLFYTIKGTSLKGTTIYNPTVHTYHNPSGRNSGTVHNLIFRCNAEYHVVVGDTLVPIEQNAVETVDDTKHDFRSEIRVSANGFGDGYDTCYGAPAGNLITANLYSPSTRIGVEFTTNKRMAQFYTGNFLDGNPAEQFGAACFEPGEGIGITHPELVERFGMNTFVRKGETKTFEMVVQWYTGDR